LRSVRLQLDLFASESARVDSEAVLRHLLEALTLADQIWIKAHPSTPGIYSSGVRYQREPEGIEDWQSIPAMLVSRFGDCEDLACWRTAELRQQGIAANPAFYFRRIGQTLLYHIVVRLPNGQTEDPSAKLGMGGRAPELARL
jgi:hypothetical protein